MQIVIGLILILLAGVALVKAHRIDERISSGRVLVQMAQAYVLAVLCITASAYLLIGYLPPE